VWEPLIHDSYTALARRARVADVSRIPMRGDSTFSPMSPISWIQGFDLASGEPTWVPYEAVFVNFVRQPGHAPIFFQGSNGLASGNRLCEAILHGLCEVIERDALCLWGFLREEQRMELQVQVSGTGSASLGHAVRTLDNKGVVLAAWEITSDIGIPTYFALVADDPESAEWRPIPMCSGNGTHLDPEIALSRAVHEAIQSRATLISGSRDDQFPGDYIRAGNRDDHARAIQSIRSQKPLRSVGDLRPPVADNFEGDLRTILARLRDVGLDSVIVVDLSRPDVGIAVVKVIVPGLEPPRQAFYRPGARAKRRMASLSS
jgi:YcaO-like protein with predicted kinase domain